MVPPNRRCAGGQPEHLPSTPSVAEPFHRVRSRVAEHALWLQVLALESYQQYPRSPAPLPRLAERPASPRLSVRSEKQRLRSPAAAPNGRHEGGAATASSDTSLTPGRAIALGSKADPRQHEAGAGTAAALGVWCTNPFCRSAVTQHIWSHSVTFSR